MKYKVQDSKTGLSLVLEGDSPPTESELEQVFTDVAQRGITQSVSSAVGVTQTIEKAIESGAEASQMGQVQSELERNILSTPPTPRDSLERAAQNFQMAGQAAGESGARGPLGMTEPFIPIPKILGNDPRVKAFITGAIGRVPTEKEADTVSAIVNSASGLAEFAESPTGLLTSAAGTLGSVAQKMIAAGFATQLAASVPEQAKKAGELSVTGTPQEALEADIALGFSVAAPGLLAKSALPKSILEKAAPLTAAELDKQPQAAKESLSEASAGPKALTVGETEKSGPITRSGPPTPQGEKGAQETVVPTQEDVSAIERVRSTENGGRLAIVLPNGTAVIGGKFHGDLWVKSIEQGVATDAELADGYAGFVKPNGSAWGVNGKPLPIVSKVYIIDDQATPKPPALPRQRPPEPSEVAKPPEKGPDAIQERSATEVPLETPPGSSKAVGEGIPKPEEAPISQVQEKEVAQEPVGMGGAVKSEFELSQKSPTSIKNAIVDEERQSRGMPPAMEPLRRKFGTVWDEAMSKIDRDPEAPDRLIAELKESPHSITDTEDAILLHRQVDLQNTHARVMRELALAYDEGRTEAMDAAKIQAAALSDKLLELYNVEKTAGTATARGLNARKMLANEDFSLASMELQKRTANEGRPLTDAERQEITRLHDKITKLQQEYDEYRATTEQKLQDLQASEGVSRVKAEADKESKAGRVKSTDPGTIIKAIQDKASKEQNADVGSLIQKLARYYVQQGIRERGALINAVHNAVKDAIPDWTRRDTMDAISGYGKFTPLRKDDVSVILRDLKGQMQQVGKLEDMAAGEAPKKTGLERRSPSDEERALIKQVEEAKRAGGYNVTDPATQLRSALQAVKTRLTNQIKDLEKQISTRQKIVKQRTSVQYDAEANSLKARRDELKSQFDEIFGKPELTDAQRLANWKKRTQARITELQDRMAVGDFSPRQRRPLPMDSEAGRLQAQLQRVKDAFHMALVRDRMAKRSSSEKVLDTIAKWRRGFVLSSPITLAKLTSAAAERISFTTGEEAIGAGIGKLLPELSKASPREGGRLNTAALAKSYSESVSKGMKDAWDTLKSGRSDLDVLFGKKPASEPTPIEFFGHVHGMLKAPVKRFEFTLAYEKISEHYARKGIDISDPSVQMRIGVEAYKYANRSIFLQDNRLVSFYKRGLSAFEEKSKDTGMELAGKAASTTARVLLPIVKVPTNIVAETLQYAGGTPYGVARAVYAYAKGIEKIKPGEADHIMRSLKKGSIGAALLAVGYFNPDLIGGYYQPRQKRDPEDVKFGALRIPGTKTDIPYYLVHNPLLNCLQIGSTIRRVADSKTKKSDTETQGVAAGVGAALFGVIEETPFAREMFAELTKLFETPKEREDFLKEFTANTLTPQLSSWAAKQLDKDSEGNVISRKPETFKEHFEMGIPGLRQDVPEKKQGRSQRKSSPAP